MVAVAKFVVGNCMIVSFDRYLACIGLRSPEAEGLCKWGVAVFLLAEAASTYMVDGMEFCTSLNLAIEQGRVMIFVDPTGIPVSFVLLSTAASDCTRSAGIEVEFGSCTRGSTYQTAAYLLSMSGGDAVTLTRRTRTRCSRRYMKRRAEDLLVRKADAELVTRGESHRFSRNSISDQFYQSAIEVSMVVQFILKSGSHCPVDIAKLFSVVSYLMSVDQCIVSRGEGWEVKAVLLWAFLDDGIDRRRVENVWWKIPAHQYSSGARTEVIARFGGAERVDELVRSFYEHPPIPASELRERVGLLGGAHVLNRKVIALD